MREQWLLAQQKFNALSFRERAMALGAIVFLILYALFNQLVSDSDSYQKKQQQISELQEKIELTEIILAEYQAQEQLDPNQEYQLKLSKLQQQINQFEDQLAIKNIVPASYMPTLLTNVLQEIDGVELVSLDSIPSQSIAINDDQSKLNLFSHGSRLIVKGEFFPIVKFLTEIEAMPDKLMWKKMDLSVENFPIAHLVLEFYTLSTNKEFIHVAE